MYIIGSWPTSPKKWVHPFMAPSTDPKEFTPAIPKYYKKGDGNGYTEVGSPTEATQFKRYEDAMFWLSGFLKGNGVIYQL